MKQPYSCDITTNSAEGAFTDEEYQKTSHRKILRKSMEKDKVQFFVALISTGSKVASYSTFRVVAGIVPCEN